MFADPAILLGFVSGVLIYLAWEFTYGTPLHLPFCPRDRAVVGQLVLLCPRTDRNRQTGTGSGSSLHRSKAAPYPGGDRAGLPRAGRSRLRQRYPGLTRTRAPPRLRRTA